jgi:coproporphyrinogen III oxidase-like Fe-S oxidoreductase/wyosine [tRNA(Phe)-imidazoG37] synthetase (radical SAM superfamily)
MSKQYGLIKRIHPDLPIFCLDQQDHCVLYTAGQFVVVDSDTADELQNMWTVHFKSLEPGPSLEIASWLERQARNGLKIKDKTISKPYQPECLTLYLGNECHLNCVYCFSSNQAADTQQTIKKSTLNLEVIYSAASLVMAYCSKKRTPFKLVLHGGGEPTLQWELLVQVVKMTQRMATQRQIGWHGYIATNGIISEQRAQWLARHFDVVGISCDGPPDIQVRQRPARNAKSTSDIIIRSAKTIRASGGSLELRATITRDIMRRQVEIVSYMIENMRPDRIRFEPVYVNRNLDRLGFRATDADQFVQCFIQAQETASKLGSILTFSGVRPQEVHSAYCDPLRDVLRLTHDGVASACFLCVDSEQPLSKRFSIGNYDPVSKSFQLDQAAIDVHREQASQIEQRCHQCINVLHCSGTCPDRCRVLETGHGQIYNNSDVEESANFRCLMQQGLMRAWLIQRTKQTLEDASKDTPRSDPAVVTTSLQELSRYMDTRALELQWQARKRGYKVSKHTMPKPIWHERGLNDDRLTAWAEIRKRTDAFTDSRPIASYIHIPFCESKCGFCDCYSFAAGRKKNEQMQRYVKAIIDDMALWRGQVLQNRWLSTVHFGGGTPNLLTHELLERCVVAYREYFNTIPDTEWALESTSRLLSDQHLAFLASIGFTRLHVGVQTLEEPLRDRLGRSDTANEVLEKLCKALEYGFVTSVDLIYDIPGQSISSLIDSLNQLIEIGIHGVSLYHLNKTRRNRAFFRRYKPSDQNPLHPYFLFLGAEQLLLNHGYQKNHFAHYCLKQDKNLYYTHALREQDLLSFGATADGIIGDYIYRYPEYSDYMEQATGISPVLEGGIRKTISEQKATRYIAALMHGHLQGRVVDKLMKYGLLERWMDAAFITNSENSGGYILTGSGSWFVNVMIAELMLFLDAHNHSLSI